MAANAKTQKRPGAQAPQKRPRRAVIEGVQPEIDCGRFPAKRVAGDLVAIEADIFTDGHDALAAVLRYRAPGDDDWQETPFQPLVNDRWRATFRPAELGQWHYTIQAWVDDVRTWRRDFEKRAAAGVVEAIDLQIGSELIQAAAGRASGPESEQLRRWADDLRGNLPLAERTVAALDPEMAALAERFPDRSQATDYGKELTLVVDRERARYSSWYELFPRSTGEHGQHGTFRSVEKRLPYIAGMGFDVLYLPPIHPIGASHRKGRNNALVAEPGEPGSPWAIGGEAGGHRAINPELGTVDDLRHLIQAAAGYGVELALDIAFQASPNHPYVQEHPTWFRRRPDGTIQYAENPPKKYEDIYPFEFASGEWRELWQELLGVVHYWIEQGVRIFRVDNPHTKPFAFWQWLIDALKAEHPEVIFLSEAFTRPKVMYRLAKLGFDQSYTYFAWRNAKWELIEYFTELTRTEVVEYFRPNLWPNTPDILTEQLQTGLRPVFLMRLILAATLSASYGIYGPAFELLEHQPRTPGSEEYLNSEKYQIRQWDLTRPESIADFIGLVNRIRRDNPALQANRSLRFHPIDNDQLIAYSKVSADGRNVVLTIVNLDPHYPESGWIDLDLSALGLRPDQSFSVVDLLTGEQFFWHGAHNFVMLNPQVLPAHVLAVRTQARDERDFEYYL
ncbi:MAG TPA: alpha-1,4-glucan--maltose-1-phosphate maltosyltransferase [Thermomicrobiaceae bacterium]|nr:alpha-1,4-glucan--maltose-1-phosphate maltosyltransferase [Thermomicrobiaceae bacterium]